MKPHELVVVSVCPLVSVSANRQHVTKKYARETRTPTNETTTWNLIIARTPRPSTVRGVSSTITSSSDVPQSNEHSESAGYVPFRLIPSNYIAHLLFGVQLTQPHQSIRKRLTTILRIEMNDFTELPRKKIKK